MDHVEYDNEPSFCWVTTKWGRFKAKIILETIEDDEHYIIVEMLDSQFTEENKTQTFNKKLIEYIN